MRKKTNFASRSSKRKNINDVEFILPEFPPKRQTIVEKFLRPKLKKLNSDFFNEITESNLPSSKENNKKSSEKNQSTKRIKFRKSISAKKKINHISFMESIKVKKKQLHITGEDLDLDALDFSQKIDV